MGSDVQTFYLYNIDFAFSLGASSFASYFFFVFTVVEAPYFYMYFGFYFSSPNFYTFFSPNFYTFFSPNF